MSRFKIYWIVCLIVAGFASCGDDENLDPQNPGETGNNVDNLLPPGSTYIPQGKFSNNLNVIYYITTDSDTIPGWHRRLSGIVRHAQDYYRGEMARHGLGNKTFNLVLNEQNPYYVKISYVKSEKISSDDCKDPSGIFTAKLDLIDWLKKNPEEKVGNHFMIFMPGESADFFHGTYGNWTDGSLLGMCFVASDFLGFSIEGFYNNQASVGGVLHELGHALFLQHNSQRAWESPKVALMNSGNWSYLPGNEHNVPLTLMDVMWLNEIEPFNEKENQYKTAVSYNMGGMELKSDKDNIYAKLRFTTEQEIAGVTFYNDPWYSSDELKDDASHEYTEYDALSYFVCADANFSDKGTFVRNGNSYEVSLVMPWADLDGKFKIPHADFKNVKAEIRFRLIFKGGRSIPGPNEGPKGGAPRYYYQIHNENPDIVARYLDRSSWTVSTSDGSDGSWLVSGNEYVSWFTSVGAEAVIDMKEPRAVRALFLQPGTSPKRANCVKVQGSLDGQNYTDILPKYYLSDDNIESYEAILPGGETNIRYLKLILLKAKVNSSSAAFNQISIFPSYK